MKKNDVILLCSALLFSFLFYKQSPGVNCFLFSLSLSAFILLLNPQKINDKQWWFYCACSLLAGGAVLMINSVLSIFAFVASIIVLSGKSFNPQNSILLSGISTAYSVLSSIVFWSMEITTPASAQSREEKHNKWKILGSVLLGLLLVMVFFYLYRASNPLFADQTKFINFELLSFGWICFTFMAFLLMHGLLRNQKIKLLNELDTSLQADIVNLPEEKKDAVSGIMVWVVFVMLNLMLLFLNWLDIRNIYIAQKLPAGITLSDFVHQAVESTIISIVIAVSLICLFFRGELNFTERGKKLKWLVYIWIAQSALVVINTMIRNYWYINEYQLTHQRIGVFVFLILCLVGLAFTWFKLARSKSAWRLAVLNFETWFLLLIMSSLVNWDRVVTNYNINHATSSKTIDKTYLMTELSDANNPELVELFRHTKFTRDEKLQFYRKLLKTYKKDRFAQWQSFNFRSKRNNELFIGIDLKKHAK